VALLAEPAREQPAHLGLVFDDQDPHVTEIVVGEDEARMRLIALSSADARLPNVYTTGERVTQRGLSESARTSRRRGPLFGGAEGNARLTSLGGAALIVLLAAEGATIPFLRSLLSVHIFVGMLLLGPVALKLASTGYRFARYYLRGSEYTSLGPPVPLMRFLVAPVLVLSTLTLLGTGVALLAMPHRGAVLGLHKASFLVWFGSTSIHVLAYARCALRHVVADVRSARLGGERWRLASLALAVAAGLAVAVATYPLASPWLHGALGWDR
jgi:hypothetical protein